MIKIGLIGCGNIGNIISNHAGGIEIVALFDIFFDRAKELEKMTGARAHEQFDTFISEDFDIVVEAKDRTAGDVDLFPVATGRFTESLPEHGISKGADAHDDEVFAMFKNPVCVGHYRIHRGSLDNNIKIFGNKGIKLFMCPCTGNLFEFICPVKKNIKEGNNLDPPGVVSNNVPDVTASDQADFDH